MIPEAINPAPPVLSVWFTTLEWFNSNRVTEKNGDAVVRVVTAFMAALSDTLNYVERIENGLGEDLATRKELARKWDQAIAALAPDYPDDVQQFYFVSHYKEDFWLGTNTWTPEMMEDSNTALRSLIERLRQEVQSSG